MCLVENIGVIKISKWGWLGAAGDEVSTFVI
jgi:hypothetical protein